MKLSNLSQNSIFAVILLLCVGVLFSFSFVLEKGGSYLPFRKEIRLSDGREAGNGKIVRILPEDPHDTLVFSGFLDCPTVCATSLPWLEKLGEAADSNSLRLVFLDLSGDFGDEKEEIHRMRFPHVVRIVVPPSNQREILSQLGLDRFEKSHHSARLFIHERKSDKITWQNRVGEKFYKDWFNRHRN